MQILNSSGADAVGLDIEPLNNKGTAVIKGDARSMPFKDSSFDAVITILVLPHICEVQKVICEMKRVIKNEGRILVVLFNKSLLNFPAYMAIRLGIRKMGYEYIKYYSLKDAKRLFQQAGFKVTRTYTTNFHPPLLGPLLAKFFSQHDNFCLHCPMVNGQGRLLILEASLEKSR